MSITYDKAMTTLLTMFADIDQAVIETVLKSNAGYLEPTVEQLLHMQVQNEEKSSLDASDQPQSPTAAQEDSPEPGSPAPTIDPSEEIAQQL